MNLRDRTHQLILLATIAFVAAWWLPVLEDLPGWMAFRYSLSSLLPYKGVGGGMSFSDAAPQVISALTNFIFMAVALALYHRRGRPALLIRIAVGCLLVNSYWFAQSARSSEIAVLLVGYYVWLLAFALLVAAAWLRLRAANAAP